MTTADMTDLPYAAEDIGRLVAAARAAQATWAARPLAERLAVLRRARGLLVEQADVLLEALALLPNRSRIESLTAELMPLADAIAFLQRRAPAILRARNAPGAPPRWLGRADLQIHRAPHGLVLIIGPANYPLFLPGVQVIQALAAGNAALIKPGLGGGAAARALRDVLLAAGLDPHLLTVLPESVLSVPEAMDAGVDKLFLTGSLAAGRAVYAAAAEAMVPAVLELSGCDAALVLRSADLDRFAAAIRFALTFSGSVTCIAPRRVIAPADMMPSVEARLLEALKASPPVRLQPAPYAKVASLVSDACAAGARLIRGSLVPPDMLTPLVLSGVRPHMELACSDIAAPVLSLIAARHEADAIALANSGPYALGASVFGDAAAAHAVALQLRAGVVQINDLLVPTADPRLPFGGCGASGFGTTRGAEGLLEMTRPKAVTTRRGPARHLAPRHARDELLLTSFFRAAHASRLGQRLRAAGRIVSEIVRRAAGRS